MVRLDVFPGEHSGSDLLLVEIRRDGELLCSTTDFFEAARHLIALGVDAPLRAIFDAACWGALEIHERSFRGR